MLTEKKLVLLDCIAADFVSSSLGYFETGFGVFDVLCEYRSYCGEEPIGKRRSFWEALCSGHGYEVGQLS